MLNKKEKQYKSTKTSSITKGTVDCLESYPLVIRYVKSCIN